MCAVMSQEGHVWYAFKTGWNRTDSPFSLVDEVLMRVIMYKTLGRKMCANYLQLAMYMEWSSLIIEVYSR